MEDTARKEPEKKKHSLWLHTKRLKRFRALCEKGGTSADRVIDAWIGDALEEAEGKK